MAQLDPMHRHGNNPKSTNSPAAEQGLRVKDSQTWSPRSYTSSSSSNQELHDPEDIHYHSKKSTVLSKVKDKARRWKSSLLKKKDSEGGDYTPSWGVRLEDDEDYEEEDPEYLGAPMYESELAPDELKEHARQNPRADPVISDKHVLASSVEPVSEHGKNELTLAETKAKKQESNEGRETDGSQKIASKIQGLFVSEPTGTGSETEKATHQINNKLGSDEADKFATTYKEIDKHVLENDTPLSPRENKWDKGVSVKEYIMNKFEPGEDERALSQVISEALSPRKTPGDIGVMEKVRGAVNSLLKREEQPAHSTIKQSDHTNSSSSQIPITDVAQANPTEDNKGRILQTN